MIYGAINEKGEKYYTSLKKVFDAIENRQNDYNWLITNCECYPSDVRIKKLLDKEYCWISGEDLTEIVSQEDFQWIWSVLSGFDKSIELSKVLEFDLPYADGYERLWKKPITLHHPLAHLEIVAWDSSSTLIFSEDKVIVDDFIMSFPYSQKLEDYIDNKNF